MPCNCMVRAFADSGPKQLYKGTYIICIVGNYRAGVYLNKCSAFLVTSQMFVVGFRVCVFVFTWPLSQVTKLPLPYYECSLTCILNTETFSPLFHFTITSPSLPLILVEFGRHFSGRK